MLEAWRDGDSGAGDALFGPHFLDVSRLVIRQPRRSRSCSTGVSSSDGR
jgi:hypothetical protein